MFNKEEISRRDILAGAGALALAAITASPAFAEDDAHQHHHADANPNAEAIKTANECVAAGQACIAHCIEMIKGGDTSMGECNAAVHISVQMCQTLAILALNNSKLLKDFAKICIISCTDCEAACRKHEKTMAPCAACAKACRNCIETCKKLAA